MKFSKHILCNENAEMLLNFISTPKATVGKIYQFVLNFITEDTCSFEDLNPSGYSVVLQGGIIKIYG